MLLEIKGLTKQYAAPDGGDGVEVLRGVNLAVEAGDTVAIIGPSGSGKSTLLNIIGTLEDGDGGSVIIDGQDVSNLGSSAVASFRNTTVGFIFQLHHLLPQCTILENVLIPTLARDGKKPAAADRQARALQLLNDVGLSHRAGHRPGELSGGERQRGAVARALINKPKLLLADEPTGSLDRATAGTLADLLLGLNQRHGVTLILVTHARDLAARMKRVFELKDGQLVATTATDQ